MLKKGISTSIWSAQHPNAGQNVKHICLGLKTNIVLLFALESWDKKMEVVSITYFALILFIFVQWSLLGCV